MIFVYTCYTIILENKTPRAWPFLHTGNEIASSAFIQTFLKSYGLNHIAKSPLNQGINSWVGGSTQNLRGINVSNSSLVNR